MYKYIYCGEFYIESIEKEIDYSLAKGMLFGDTSEILYFGYDGFLIGYNNPIKPSDVEREEQFISGFLTNFLKSTNQAGHVAYVDNLSEIHDVRIDGIIEEMNLDGALVPIITSLYSRTKFTTSFSCESHPELGSTLFTADDKFIIHNSAYIVFDQDDITNISPPDGWYWDLSDRENLFGQRRKHLGLGTSTLRVNTLELTELPPNSIINEGTDTYSGVCINMVATKYKFDILTSLKKWVDDLAVEPLYEKPALEGYGHMNLIQPIVGGCGWEVSYVYDNWDSGCAMVLLYTGDDDKERLAKNRSLLMAFGDIYEIRNVITNYEHKYPNQPFITHGETIFDAAARMEEKLKEYVDDGDYNGKFFNALELFDVLKDEIYQVTNDPKGDTYNLQFRIEDILSKVSEKQKTEEK